MINKYIHRSVYTFSLFKHKFLYLSFAWENRENACIQIVLFILLLDCPFFLIGTPCIIHDHKKQANLDTFSSCWRYLQKKHAIEYLHGINLIFCKVKSAICSININSKKGGKNTIPFFALQSIMFCYFPSYQRHGYSHESPIIIQTWITYNIDFHNLKQCLKVIIIKYVSKDIVFNVMPMMLDNILFLQNQTL